MVLLVVTNAAHGAPSGAERTAQIDEMPEELSLRDYLKLVHLRALKEEMDDNVDSDEEERFEKRARFRPRLGKRSYNFRARLGVELLQGSQLCLSDVYSRECVEGCHKERVDRGQQMTCVYIEDERRILGGKTE
ncbi:unnamed protein product [Hydatigera taeniaeformis]|uniref:Secreted protein n=1 Tax=Hydatigena taeniaeformis TaxID=6205 RepID=A0A0R3X4G4_HYDTA|nr:unnamed protein product [Hydatigera taeniaeformis]